MHSTLGSLRVFQAFSLPPPFSQSTASPSPAPAQVTQTVGWHVQNNLAKLLSSAAVRSFTKEHPVIFGIPLALLLIFAGLRATFQSMVWLFQWKRSQDWHSVRGKIIQSNLQSMLVPRGGRKSQNFDGSVRVVTAFTPDILYAYRVNAEAFQSKQIFIGQQFPASFRVSDDLVEKYPIGKEVTVFYDPDRPAFAVLERDRLKVLLEYLGGSLLFIFFEFAVLVQVLQQR